LEEYDLVCRIHEMRSYIASDWPSVDERKRLYEALKEFERLLKETKDDAEKTKSEKDKET